MPEHAFGWVRDSLDHRDQPLNFVRAGAPTPPKTDLRAGLPACFDQGQLGSCTANAWAAAYEFDQRKQDLTDFMPSRLLIYYNERVLEKSVKSDSGAQIRDGAKVIAKQGVCPESEWPYVVSAFAKKPPKACYTDAKKHQGLVYQSVPQTVDAMRACLAGGFPIVVGFTVMASFESDAVAKTGIAPMPKPHEQVLGGHAVLVVGHDDNDDGGRFLCRNSWGTDWGLDAGHFTLPYAYLTNPKLAGDFWTMASVAA